MTVVGSIPPLGRGNPSRGLRLTCDPVQGIWSGDITLRPGQRDPFDYRYVIVDEKAAFLHGEGGKDRVVEPRTFSECETVVLMDYWKPPANKDDIFETAPFRNVIFKRQPPAESPDKNSPVTGPPPLSGSEPPDRESSPNRLQGGVLMRMQVAAACVPPGQRLYLTGEPPLLGAWAFQKALPMHPGRYPYWQTDFIVDAAAKPFAYKYAVGDASRGMMTWESGSNRTFVHHATGRADEKRAVMITDWPFQYPGGPWRGSGISIPVFSLRTEQSLGIGEFTDIKHLVDWAKQMDLQMIQLLPVNDTSTHGTWYDSYPYAIISAFALHPIYLNLSELARPGTSLAEEIAALAERLNQSPVLEYENVMTVKTTLMKDLFREESAPVFASPAFRDFFRAHADWLRPYAAFCCLRDRYRTCDHRHWGEDHPGTPEAVARLTDPEAPNYADISFHYFVQYHLHRQLSEAAAYARGQGLILKGDIPIGVARGSVETWLHPEWFHMEEATGAPPDDFTEAGQNWGFPTYHWEAMAADGYSWWEKRLHHLSSYFDAVRLDHIIGFFRIWTIPEGSITALKGRFYPSLPLTRAELEENGIDNIDDLCRPHITDRVLEELFGSDAEAITRTYLDEKAPGTYAFKASFLTQRQIEASLAAAWRGAREDVMFQKRFLGLLRLHDDVILIPEHPGSQEQFHPRILMDTTCHFQTLDEEIRQSLRRLYQDYFFKRQEDFWRASGLKKLSALTAATEMLICGEDLGMVPRCVPDVLEQLHILSLRIQRMPIAFGELFGHPADYPYLSVASPGSHDMSSIRGWWEETDRAVIQFFYQNMLGHRDIAPKTCTPRLCKEIIDLHLRSGSLWTVIPAQDLLGINGTIRQPNPRTERVNDPSAPHHNWNFRLHRTMEDLLSQAAFIAEVREMVRAAKQGNPVNPD